MLKVLGTSWSRNESIDLNLEVRDDHDDDDINILIFVIQLMTSTLRAGINILV